MVDNTCKICGKKITIFHEKNNKYTARCFSKDCMPRAINFVDKYCNTEEEAVNYWNIVCNNENL